MKLKNLKNSRKKLESKLEKDCVKYATKVLNLYEKKEGLKGQPDRRFINKYGTHLYIEFKREDETLRRLQESKCKKLKEYNCKVYLVDNLEYGKKILYDFSINAI